MLASLFKSHYLLLHIILTTSTIKYVKATWPSSIASRIRLLGIFPNPNNATQYDEWSVHSAAMFRAAIILSQQFNITIGGEYIGWQIEESKGNAIYALTEACRAVPSSNITGIIGPGFSREASFIAPFGDQIGIPVISYAATDPELSDRIAFSSFYRTVPSDNTAALALQQLFKRYNWTACILIHQNDAFGNGGAKVISDRFNMSGLTVAQTIVFDISTRSIQGDFNFYLNYASTRIVVVWATTMYASIILDVALTNNLVGPYYTWILSDYVPLSSFDEAKRKNLTGMLLVEPVVASAVNEPYNATLLNAAYKIWNQTDPQTFPGPTAVSNFALFAFDATWLLIQALSNFCSTTVGSSSECVSFVGSSFCFDNYFLNKSSLLNAISETEFLGVSGSVSYNHNETDRVTGCYYQLQNIQLLSTGLTYVPVLQYSTSHGWQVPGVEVPLMWPDGSSDVPTGRAILKGVNLRIGLIESDRFTIVHKKVDDSGVIKYEFHGYIIDLINALQAKAQFNPTLVLAPSNQTYSQTVQAVSENVYDIVVGDVTVTSKRREIVDFSSPIFDNSLRIIMRKSNDVDIDLLAFLKPFSRNLWLVVLGTCLYSGVLFCLIERHDNEELQNRSFYSQLLMGIWFSFGHLVGYGVEYDARTAPGRIITVGLYIVCLIVVASYTANLASDLTISKSKDSISGIDDIKNGKITFNKIGVRVGTASEDYFLREISGGVKNYQSLNSQQELYDKLLARVIDVSFWDAGITEYVTNNIYCNLSVVGDEFDKGVFGIVTPKNWIFSQDLDVAILSLREAGALDKFKKQWFDVKNCATDDDRSSGMSVQAIGGLFVVFLVISGLAILLFLWIKRARIIRFCCALCFKKKASTEENYTMDNVRKNDFKEVEYKSNELSWF